MVENGSASHNSPRIQSSVLAKTSKDYGIYSLGAYYVLNGQNMWEKNNGDLRAWAEGYGIHLTPGIPPSAGMWISYKRDSIEHPLVKFTFDAPKAGWYRISILGFNILPLALFEDDNGYLPSYGSQLKQWFTQEEDYTYTETLLLPVGTHKMVFFPRYNDDTLGYSDWMFIKEIQIKFVEADDSAGN